MTEILPLAALAERLRSQPERGRTVVLANGCFDLLHVGHLRYLEDAKQLGDQLVVGINSDRSVRDLKGAGRPLQNERDRAALVAAFRCVDFVFVFDEPTIETALRILRPDIHAKGTDYTPEDVPEAAVSRELGIRVAITGDPKSHATRDIIKQVLAIPS
jgi:rfaE bifunctional protein nucleotidyltransferase chain/domain